MRASSPRPFHLGSCLVALGGLSACSPGPINAPYGSGISWSETTINTEVGLYCDTSTEPDYTGASMMLDVFVVDPDGLPLERAVVEIESNAIAGVYVLPQEAVKTVDLPAVDADVTSDADIRDACTDDEGNYDNTNEWCAWYGDETNAQYYQFGEDYASAGGYAPTYFIGETDSRGLMRVYLFLDCVYGDSTMEASIGVANDTFTISAETATE